MGIGGAQGYVLGRGGLPESRVDRERVHVDPVQQAAELGFAVAHVGAQLGDAWAAEPEPQPRGGEPMLDAERLGCTRREPRGRPAAEQRREDTLARPAGDRHLGAARRLLGQAPAFPVERADEGREAGLGVAAEDRPAGLGHTRFREADALAQARADENAGLGRDRVREPEARGNARRHGRRRARADDAVDPAGVGEPLERELVVGLEDRAAMGQPESGSARVAIDHDQEAATRAGGREQAGLPRAEHEQPHDGRPYNGAVTSILGERVAELRADREHGASWMARRAVEALAEVATEPAASGEELLERLVVAGRELAESRPGVGAVAGAAGRLLAAAAANVQLEVPELQRLIGEEAESLVDGRRRAGASIAIQLRERLEDAVVLTHSASATVREALLYSAPDRVICTASSPQDEGRAFADDLRSHDLEVELVEDDEAVGQLEWASVLLLGADTVFHDGTLCNKTGTLALAEAAAAQSVPVVVACEVVKLAPIDAADAPEIGRAHV